MRRASIALVLLLCASIGASSLLGHGGSFPPGGSPGGTYRGPGDSTTGPGSGGPSGPGTGAPTGPTTGGSGGDPDDGPTTPSAPVRPPATPGGGGPGTPLGKRVTAEVSHDRWERWWELNREAYLAARRPSGLHPTTGPSDATPRANTRPDADEVARRVAPALMRSLGEDHPIILDSTAIAIGRSLPAASAEKAVVAMHGLLSSPYPSVRQSAILALGMLQHRSSVPILWGVLNDTQQGRKSLGRTGPIAQVDRAFAAFALGFLGDTEIAAPILMRRIEGGGDAEPEVAAAAVLAIGLLPHAGRAVPALIDVLSDRKVDYRVRAQVPIALLRIGTDARSALPAILETAGDAREHRDVRRSCVIALGRLSTAADREAVEKLIDLCRKERDGLMRHFGLISLGRAGAAAAEDPNGRETLERIASYLRSEVSDPKRSMDRPWAAVAGGIAGYPLAPGDRVLGSLRDEVRDWLKRSRAASDVAAAAVALALMGDESAGEELLSRFEDARDPSLRTHLATSLGLLEYRPAEDALQEALLNHNDPGLRVEAARALARLGRREVGDELVRMLVQAPTFAASAAIARSLGRLGDRRHLAGLIDLAGDRDRPDVLRGFACVAIGMISEKTALPWNAPLAMDSNFALPLEAQREILDIF